MVSELPFQRSHISLQVITSMVLSIITAVFNGCMAFTCATMIPFYANARVVDYDHADDHDDNYDYSYGYNVSSLHVYLLRTFVLRKMYHRNAKMHMIDLCVQIIINWQKILECK